MTLRMAILHRFEMRVEPLVGVTSLSSAQHTFIPSSTLCSSGQSNRIPNPNLMRLVRHRLLASHFHDSLYFCLVPYRDLIFVFSYYDRLSCLFVIQPLTMLLEVVEGCVRWSHKGSPEWGVQDRKKRGGVGVRSL